MEKAMTEGMLAIFPDARIAGLAETNAGINCAEAK
jgi:hypothetical protein